MMQPPSGMLFLLEIIIKEQNTANKQNIERQDKTKQQK